MTASPTINDVLVQAKKLDAADQLTLIQQLVALLKRTETAKAAPGKLASLAGLGSAVWESADAIDRYLDEERQW